MRWWPVENKTKVEKKRTIFLLILLFLLSLFQTTFWSLNLVLGAVLVVTAFHPHPETFWLAFFTGLLLDLAQGTPLGSSSLGLLMASFFLILYSRRFDPRHPLFLFLFVWGASSLWSYFFVGYWVWQKSLVLAFLSLFFRFLIKFFFFTADWSVLKVNKGVKQ